MPAVSQIDFTNFPGSTSVLVPMTVVEFNATQANTGVFNFPTMLLGQMLSTGSATANIPFIAGTQNDVNAATGVGSMLSLMYKAYRANDPFGTVWILPLADNGSGVKAVYTATVTATSSQAGTINMYVAGVNCQTGVNTGDSATTIATNIAATINANAANVSCTATSAAGVVTITANHKGAAAGDIDLRLNYRGAIAGEITPSGVSIAFANSTAGTTDPDLATALANLPTSPFDFFVDPYALSGDLTEIEGMLSDVTGRWSWMGQQYGMAWSAYRGNFSALTTYGTSNNSQHVTVMGYYDGPDPAWRWAAAYAGAGASSLRVDPALPLNTVALQGILAPPVQSRFTLSENNSLLLDGLATFNVAQDGTVSIQRAVTTYQTNAAGTPDTSYRNVERLYTLQQVGRQFRSSLTTKFARKVLVKDGTPIPANSNMTTAQLIAGEVIAVYDQLATQGLVQDPATFAKNILWANEGNGEVAIMAPVNTANQLEIMAINVVFQST